MLTTGPNDRLEEQPLIIRVIDDLITNRLGALYLDQTVRDIRTYLKPLTPVQQRQFVARLVLYDGFWDELRKLDALTFLQVTRLLRGATGDDRRNLTNSIDTRLKAGDAALWAAAVQNGDATYQLAIEFSNELPAWPAKSEFYSGVASLTAAVVQSQDRQLMKRWFALSGQLTDPAQAKALEALGEEVAKGGHIGDLVSLLKESDGKLLGAAALKPAVLVRSVIVPLIETAAGRRWLEGHFKELQPKISRAPRDAVLGLRNEIDRLGRSASKGRQNDAAQLRSLFGMK